MSFIQSLVTHTGIVMAADHSSTLLSTDGKIHLKVSDTKEKLYITPNNIGISGGHQAFIKSIPIERYINNFLYSFDSEKLKTPKEVANSLLVFIRNIDPDADIIFHVAGYELADIPKPQLYEVVTRENLNNLVNKQEYIPSMAYACANNFPEIIFPFVANRLNDFSMQEAIEFTVLVIDVTRKIMELSGTGGGISKDIDVLAIYPNRHKWVNKMELHI